MKLRKYLLVSLFLCFVLSTNAKEGVVKSVLISTNSYGGMNVSPELMHSTANAYGQDPVYSTLMRLLEVAQGATVGVEIDGIEELQKRGIGLRRLLNIHKNEVPKSLAKDIWSFGREVLARVRPVKNLKGSCKIICESMRFIKGWFNF